MYPLHMNRPFFMMHYVPANRNAPTGSDLIILGWFSSFISPSSLLLLAGKQWDRLHRLVIYERDAGLSSHNLVTFSSTCSIIVSCALMIFSLLHIFIISGVGRWWPSVRFCALVSFSFLLYFDCWLTLALTGSYWRIKIFQSFYVFSSAELMLSYSASWIFLSNWLASNSQMETILLRVCFENKS